MRTSADIQNELHATTNPVRYDELTEELAEAIKTESIAEAKRRAEIELQARKEREITVKQYQEFAAAIDAIWQKVDKCDQRIYELVAELEPLMSERVDLAADASNRVGIAIGQAEHLGLPYPRRAVGLVGGENLYMGNGHMMLKTWLQRAEDWRKRLGRKPTFEEITSQGLETGTEADDLPEKY